MIWQFSLRTDAHRAGQPSLPLRRVSGLKFRSLLSDWSANFPRGWISSKPSVSMTHSRSSSSTEKSVGVLVSSAFGWEDTELWRLTVGRFAFVLQRRFTNGDFSHFLLKLCATRCSICPAADFWLTQFGFYLLPFLTWPFQTTRKTSAAGEAGKYLILVHLWLKVVVVVFCFICKGQRL